MSGFILGNILQGKKPFSGTIVEKVGNLINPDDGPAQPSYPGFSPRNYTPPNLNVFSPDAMPRFGPSSAPYAGMAAFDQTGNRFGPGGGFDPALRARQQALSQSLRSPTGSQLQEPV